MRRSRLAFAYLWTFAFILVPVPAWALEISGGVSVGGILIGPNPRVAVTPHAGISWGLPSNFALAVNERLNLLPAVNKLGVGVYNQTSVDVGYIWGAGNFSIGPSLSIYSVPSCSAELCGRVVGIGPGGHAQMNVYFAGPVGVSASANLDWIDGASLVLPANVAVMVIAGPVIRWSPR